MSKLIFNKTFQEISDIQQRKGDSNVISGEIVKPLATPRDLELLAEHSVKGLTEKRLYGVLDRLMNSEIINKS